ncbi:MAG: ypdA 2 [Crocinitomicaceae bacterium]|jgi:ligand-binding sensor domain-containing protein|nr:ypdA 2 [Crocinitomicaceae bacterium]
MHCKLIYNFLRGLFQWSRNSGAVILAFLLLVSNAGAQQLIQNKFKASLDDPFKKPVQNPISRNFTVDEGLISNETHHVLSDSKGFVWVASDGGICRYDGTKFVNFSLADGLPERMITKLFEDRKGRIWFITISSYVGYILNDKVVTIRHQFKKGPGSTDVDDYAYSLYVDEHDSLWVGTIFSGALFKSGYPYTKKPVEKQYKTDFVIEFNQKGDYVYGTRRQRCDKPGCALSMKLHYYQKWSGKKKEFSSSFVVKNGYMMNKLVKAGPDEFYLASKNGLFSLRNGKFKAELELNIAAFDIANGKLWVSTSSEGVYIFNNRRDMGTWEQYFREEYITDFTSDIEGGSWITTLYSGVKYVPEFNFRKIMEGNDFDCIAAVGEQIFVNKKLGDLFVVKNGREAARYHSRLHYMESLGDGKHLFGFDADEFGRAIVFDIASGSRKKISMGREETPRHVRKILRYGDGYYLGISSGILQYDFKTGAIKSLFYTKSRVNNFVISRDTLWLATNNGLFSYDLVKKRWIPNIFAAKNLNFRIDDIIAGDSGLWLSTFGKGMMYYDKKEKLTFFDKKKGLLSNYIRYVYADSCGNLWIASNEGLSRLKLNHKNKIINYAYVGGYDLGQINKILRSGNNLYLTTTKGLYEFPVEKLFKRNRQLPVYIIAARSKNGTLVLENTKLDPGDDQIKIDFLAVNYASSDKSVYYYMIRGFEDSWHKTVNTSLTINKLPPGDYCFIVKTDSNSHATLRFSIRYPLWQRWWFICFMLLTLVFLVYLFFRYRTRKIKQEEQEKYNIQVQIAGLQANVIRAQMNPHFMFNALNSIQGFILANENKQASFYLGKFSSLLRKIIQASRHDFVTVKEELRLLQDYIEIEQMRCDYSFECEIKMDDRDVPGTRIPAMIIQPFVENAILHGLGPLENRKGKLSISFTKNEENIICTVTDNGIGRGRAREIKQKKIRYHQSASIKLTENRINLYNKLYKTESRISIIDLYDENKAPAGTRVEIFIPYKEGKTI